MVNHRLIQGDVLQVLPELGNFACCFLDPPDALGLKLNGYRDHPRKGYIEWLAKVMAMTIQRCGITWLSYNSQWDLAVKHWACDYGMNHQDVEIKPFYQHYTFFQCNNNDCAPAERPMLRFRHKEAPIYPNQIRVPSWRMLNGDKRASPDGKVPGNVWESPRVVGNSKQRRSWHPTQLNESLVERAILLSTRQGDEILDLFSGTGTVIRVCRRINRSTTSIELNEFYCRKIAEEHGLEVLRA
ncbi:MAG: DNA methyltransferase [Thermoguttaceae bacterium]|jgi:site-specific DNA-methyltransferase (adenine-specific)